MGTLAFRVRDRFEAVARGGGRALRGARRLQRRAHLVGGLERGRLGIDTREVEAARAGVGKLGTPFERMQSANLTAVLETPAAAVLDLLPDPQAPITSALPTTATAIASL